MIVKNTSGETECIIRQTIDVLEEFGNGYRRELNVVAWKGDDHGEMKPDVYDIREWSPGHKKFTKGITLNDAEMRNLVDCYKSWKQNSSLEEALKKEPADKDAGDVSVLIYELIGVVSGGDWNRELNIVSWNYGAPKFDLRRWDATHSRMTRGATFTEDEMDRICEFASLKLPVTVPSCPCVVVKHSFDAETAVYECPDDDSALELLERLYKVYLKEEIDNNSDLRRSQCWCEVDYARITWDDDSMTEFVKTYIQKEV